MLTALKYLLLLLLHLSASANSAAPSPATAPASSAPTAPSSAVLSACANARFRSLCVRTLRPLPPSSSPSALARAATLASLSSTRAAAVFLASAPSPSAPAFHDCASLLHDADEQLTRAADQLAHLRPGGALGNAQTWASAALTDQDMCAMGIAGLAGPTRDAVAARVAAASRFTSNALYLITRLAFDDGGRNR